MVSIVMITPQRLQLSRQRGFRLQAASLALNGLPAARVARPGRFGNMFRVEPGTGCWWCMLDRENGLQFRTKLGACRQAVMCYAEQVEADPTLKAAIVEQLKGRNLACFCPLDDEYGSRFPCHADIQLAVANA